MKITIVEDRPTVMREAILQMKDLGIQTECIICYDNQINRAQEVQKAISEMCERLNIQLKHASNIDFNKILDEAFKDKEMIFLFDMDLMLDFSRRFEERINVIYAKKKQEEGEERIWFYTTGPAAAVDSINKNFPNRNIPVIQFKAREQQVVFDNQFIERNLLGRS
jgi:hypothetical protein